MDQKSRPITTRLVHPNFNQKQMNFLISKGESSGESMSCPPQDSPHYPFFVELMNGGRVWRDDTLNRKKEWLTLAHPRINGNPANVCLFGYNDLSLPLGQHQALVGESVTESQDVGLAQIGRMEDILRDIPVQVDFANLDQDMHRLKLLCAVAALKFAAELDDVKPIWWAGRLEGLEPEKYEVLCQVKNTQIKAYKAISYLANSLKNLATGNRRGS